METITHVGRRKLPREEIIAYLRERDGDLCQHPECNRELDYTATGKYEVTLDHWISQAYGKEHGWTTDEIWDLSNLKLMCKKCNAAKGDLLPNEDGTLPIKPKSTFRFRRQKRGNRPDVPCEVCDNGHNLLINEVCAQCGCNAQRFPRHAKVRANECDHQIWWCWACSIGVTPRMGATEMIMFGGEGGG